MELLERYLYQLEKYLPFKERKEIILELRSNILDQVEQLVNTGLNEEAALKSVLETMKSPKEVAKNYISNDYLIKPELRNLYGLLLKIVILASALGILVAKIVEFITSNHTFNDILMTFLETIASLFSVGVSAFGTVTIIFILISKYASLENINKINDEIFDLKDLPELPTKKDKVSQISLIFSIILSVIGIIILTFFVDYIAIYSFGDVVSRTPIFTDSFNTFRIFMIVGALVNIGIYIHYYMTNRKTNIGKVLEYIMLVYSMIIVFTLIYGDNNINPEVLSNDLFSMVFNIVKYALTFALGMAFLVNTYEVIAQYIKVDRLK